jgi:CheY-like chemotaxis protein
MNASPANDPARILVVGRSPNVLVDTVEILRSKGYSADATNQFDRVLDDYDAQDIDIVVFGGMVPAGTKQHLRQEIGERNAHVTFVQGLAGIAGLIAAQVEGVITAGEPDGIDVVYDEDQRSVRLTLPKAAHVTVQACGQRPSRPQSPRALRCRCSTPSSRKVSTAWGYLLRFPRLPRSSRLPSARPSAPSRLVICRRAS